MRIAFCGVGALGSHAVLFCRNLDTTLRLVDFDRVESKNLLSQAYVKQSVGRGKAEALKLQLLNFWGIKAEARGVRLGADNVAELCGDQDLLVDCFDNAASRTLLSSFARARGLPLLHGALDAAGTLGLVRWDERFAPDAEDAEGQATCEGGEHLPLIVLTASVMARTIQHFVLTSERRDSMVSLGGVQLTAVGTP